MPDCSKLFIAPSSTITEAMDAIARAARERLPSGIALVTEADGTLLGVVTDGDIRRGMLAGHRLDETVDQIMTRDPIVFHTSMSPRDILNEIPRVLAEKGRYRGGVLEKVILVDEHNRVVEVLNFLDLTRQQSVLHRRVCVVGMGYVGLTLAVTLADVGFEVIGVERVADVRQTLASGYPHFHEVGLEPMLRYHMGGRLIIEAQPVPEADVYIIAVGTPLNGHKQPDLDYVRAAAEDVGAVLSYGDLVVLRSTVPFGTCRSEVLPILERQSGLTCGRDFHLAFAPERTLEGKALAELRSLPQVVGGFDQHATDLTATLFREITPSIVTVDSLEEAEMVKLVNNGFRDLIFAYANELSLICERFNLNTNRIIYAANEGYPRTPVPSPSPGVGGSCLTKDPHIFTQVAHAADVNPCLSEIGRQVNEKMPSVLVDKIIRTLTAIGKDIAKATIFIIGFAFKGEPETSDIRGSTTLDVLDLLKPHGAVFRGYDPVVSPSEIEALGVQACSLEEGFKGADCVIIMNNHRSYADMDIYACLTSTNRPAVYCDGWYIFPTEEVKQIEGITYVGLGFTV